MLSTWLIPAGVDLGHAEVMSVRLLHCEVIPLSLSLPILNCLGVFLKVLGFSENHFLTQYCRAIQLS
jgi:hypothetical protein